MSKTNLSDDSLDAMFSTFFKAQVKHPWPVAPAPSAHSEPSSLAAARAAQVEAPRNQPVVAGRDAGNKSRYTLAASVALLIGTCWTLSSGFQSADRAAPTASPNGPALNLNPMTASDPDALKELRKEKALNGNNDGFTAPKIELP
jgi:hypothetical protein